MIRVIGIDPGFSGGLAIFENHALVAVTDMPVMGSGTKTEVNPQGLLDWLSEQAKGPVDACFIERVAAMPKQGSSSTFRFGEGYGVLQGVVAALGYPLRKVTPPTWKRAFNLGSEKDESRKLAIQRWPDHSQHFARVRDDGRAEAALIAAFGSQLLAQERGQS